MTTEIGPAATTATDPPASHIPTPPVSSTAPDAPLYRGRYAGFVSRMSAGGIDVVVCAFGGSGLIFFAEALGAVIESKPIGEVSIDPGLATTMISLLILVYFTGCWAITGRTGGEALLGLRVIRPDGRRVHLIRSFVRFWMGLVSFAAFGLGFVWILFDSRRRSWQDIVARTIVVYDWDE